MEIKTNIKQCEICNEEAIALCVDCHSYFCDICFKFVHERKKKSNHKKEKIDLFIPIDTTCPDHERSPMNLFCIDEKGNKKYSFNIILIL